MTRRLVVSRALAALAASLLLAACDPDGTLSTGPDEPPAAKFGRPEPPAGTLAALLAAQGTFCGDEYGLPCGVYFGEPLNYIAAVCSGHGRYCLTVDFAGLDPAWWARVTGRPQPVAITGTIKELAMADGRRRFKADVTAEGTFVEVFRLDDESPVMGSSPPDYFDHPPAAGNVRIVWDFIVPADRAGMPDIIEVWTAGVPGLESLSLTADVTVTAPLRSAEGGMPAGAMATLRANVTSHERYWWKLTGQRRGQTWGHTGRITLEPAG